MRYFLDNNALIKLYFRKKNNLPIYRKTSVSKLVIAEILKIYNWEKDYEQRCDQLKFLTENGINIIWKSFDSIISKSFCGKELWVNSPISIFNYAPSVFIDLKLRYNALVNSESFDNFLINFSRNSTIFQSNMAEKLSANSSGEYKSIMSDLIKEFYNSSFIQDNMLNYDKYLLSNRKPYEMVKKIKNDFINTIIKHSSGSKILSDAKVKNLSRTMMKEYDKSIDLFIKCKSKYIFDKDDENIILRNDGIDLLYLLYVNIKDGDIFVTDDKDLRNFIKSISDTSTINVNEYLNINNEYGT